MVIAIPTLIVAANHDEATRAVKRIVVDLGDHTVDARHEWHARAQLTKLANVDALVLATTHTVIIETDDLADVETRQGERDRTAPAHPFGFEQRLSGHVDRRNAATRGPDQRAEPCPADRQHRNTCTAGSKQALRGP